MTCTPSGSRGAMCGEKQLRLKCAEGTARSNSLNSDGCGASAFIHFSTRMLWTFLLSIQLLSFLLLVIVRHAKQLRLVLCCVANFLLKGLAYVQKGCESPAPTRAVQRTPLRFICKEGTSRVLLGLYPLRMNIYLRLPDDIPLVTV